MHLVLQVFQVLFNKFVLVGPVDKSTFGQTELFLVKLSCGKILNFHELDDGLREEVENSL